jgi:hypothetical protein
VEKRAKRASADALAFERIAVRPQKESEFFALIEAHESPVRQWKSPAVADINDTRDITKIFEIEIKMFVNFYY